MGLVGATRCRDVRGSVSLAIENICIYDERWQPIRPRGLALTDKLAGRENHKGSSMKVQWFCCFIFCPGGPSGALNYAGQGEANSNDVSICHAQWPYLSNSMEDGHKQRHIMLPSSTFLVLAGLRSLQCSFGLKGKSTNKAQCDREVSKSSLFYSFEKSQLWKKD